tara:strand:- start:914 stop:1357 length:444 start_codon:yes stop_codon:yes gene_type:complete
MSMKFLLGSGGSLWGGAKKVASKVGSGARELGQSSRTGISAAKEAVEGAAVPTQANVSAFKPTQKGHEYLEELQSKGQVTSEDHWAFQMFSLEGQTTEHYISRMVSRHKYPGTKNQLVKNINMMLEDGYIVPFNQPEEDDEDGNVII